MSAELNEKIAELTIENDRIKKTSKQRFDKNKRLESQSKYLNLELSRLHAIRKYLDEGGFKPSFQGGVFMVHYSVMEAIRSLTNKSKPMKSPEVDGVYSVKIDGEWSVKKIRYRLCWQLFDSETDRFVGVHFYEISEYILLEAD